MSDDRVHYPCGCWMYPDGTMAVRAGCLMHGTGTTTSGRKIPPMPDAPDARLAAVVRRCLSVADADAIEAEMRALEANPGTTPHQMRLFMQHPMPCGHATGNLLTCDRPPFGCNACAALAAVDADARAIRRAALEEAAREAEEYAAIYEAGSSPANVATLIAARIRALGADGGTQGVTAHLFDGIRVLRLLGRCTDGAERGAGRHWHAVEGGVALCGARYGRWSAGWTEYQGERVTCPKCLRKMAARYHQGLLAELKA